MDRAPEVIVTRPIFGDACMIDLSTRWLGLSLNSPIVLGASPVSKDPHAVVAAVAAGAGAVVMHSLFEEQCAHEELTAHWFFEAQAKRDAEAFGLSLHQAFSFGPDDYLGELETLRRSVNVPIIASMNGIASGSWLSCAKQAEAVGASAIELNLYEIVTSSEETGESLEQRQVAIVKALTDLVAIPVTVKLRPFYSSLPSFVRRLEGARARGVTVFNRAYEPARGLGFAEDAEVLSTSAELPLRLHALSILASTSGLALACTGGVHTGLDAARAILCGAHVVQVTSALLKHGPSHVGAIREELCQWLASNGYAASDAARGVRTYPSIAHASALPRLEYAHMLDSWPSEKKAR